MADDSERGVETSGEDAEASGSDSSTDDAETGASVADRSPTDDATADGSSESTDERDAADADESAADADETEGSTTEEAGATGATDPDPESDDESTETVGDREEPDGADEVDGTETGADERADAASGDEASDDPESAESDDTAEPADGDDDDPEAADGADDESDGGIAGDDTSELWPDEEADGGEGAEAVTGTDGGTAANVGDAPAGGAGDVDSSEPLIDDGLDSEGPESDEEMPLADHIEEMVRRLAVVLGIGGIVTLLLYPGADLVNSAFGLELVSSTEVIDFLWNKHIPGAPEMVDRRPRVYGPLELLLTELKVAALGGLIVGLPAFVYETYLFMRPGLYPKERRYYLAAVPTSLVLAFVGIAFAHFIVLPAIFAYFTSYTTGTAIVAFGLKETFNLILILMGYNAVIFQIPLFVMLAIMMNLVTRRWLEDRRLLFWGTFLGLAFFVSPDPTGMAPIIIGATMITLFEGTLLLLRWTGTN